MFLRQFLPISWVISLLRKRVKRLEKQVVGVEFLRELTGQPYILAANHIKPRNIVSQMFGLAVDAFVLEGMVREQTQRKINIVANVTGRMGRIPFLRRVEKLWSPLRERMMERMGFVPARINPGSFNRHFLEIAEKKIRKGEPILIFPEGHWYEDFSSERELKEGAALIAKKYDLAIVPSYIRFERKRVIVRIGKSFKVEKKTRKQITDEIRDRITLLQNQ